MYLFIFNNNFELKMSLVWLLQTRRKKTIMFGYIHNPNGGEKTKQSVFLRFFHKVVHPLKSYALSFML